MVCCRSPCRLLNSTGMSSPHSSDITWRQAPHGVVAIAVYVLTLRKTSGGIAYDFLQRLAARQRSSVGS